MTILYACVAARPRTIIADHSDEYNQNYRAVVYSLLPNISTRHNRKAVFTNKRLHLAVLQDANILYICITPPEFPEDDAFTFLNNLARSFILQNTRLKDCVSDLMNSEKTTTGGEYPTSNHGNLSMLEEHPAVKKHKKNLSCVLAEQMRGFKKRIMKKISVISQGSDNNIVIQDDNANSTPTPNHKKLGCTDNPFASPAPSHFQRLGREISPPRSLESRRISESPSCERKNQCEIAGQSVLYSTNCRRLSASDGMLYIPTASLTSRRKESSITHKASSSNSAISRIAGLTSSKRKRSISVSIGLPVSPTRPESKRKLSPTGSLGMPTVSPATANPSRPRSSSEGDPWITQDNTSPSSFTKRAKRSLRRSFFSSVGSSVKSSPVVSPTPSSPVVSPKSTPPLSRQRLDRHSSSVSPRISPGNSPQLAPSVSFAKPTKRSLRRPFYSPLGSSVESSPGVSPTASLPDTPSMSQASTPPQSRRISSEPLNSIDVVRLQTELTMQYSTPPTSAPSSPVSSSPSTLTFSRKRHSRSNFWLDQDNRTTRRHRKKIPKKQKLKRYFSTADADFRKGFGDSSPRKRRINSCQHDQSEEGRPKPSRDVLPTQTQCEELMKSNDISNRKDAARIKQRPGEDEACTLLDERIKYLQYELVEVEEIVKHSIDLVLTRGEALDDLLSRAEDLSAAAKRFKQTSSRLRRKKLWQKRKTSVWIAIGVCVVLVTLGAVLTIVLLV